MLVHDDKYRKRLNRYEIPGHARALNWSCFGNQRLLASERARLWTTDAIERARERHGFRVWAWCIMPSHVHLLIATGRGISEQGIPAILSSIKQSVAKRAVAWARTERPATLARMADKQPNGSVSYRFWQRGGGYDRNLYSTDAVREMIKYIHMNPVEEGLCERPEDWRWSSAAQFSGREGKDLRVDLESLRRNL